MKKILILLMVSAMFTACSRNNDDVIGYDEVKGYLINIPSVEKGMLGLWESTVGGKVYRKIGTDKIINVYVGTVEKEQPDYSMKFEIIKDGNKYIFRQYYVGDIDGIGLYDDLEIVQLTRENFEYKLELMGGTALFKRVVQ